MYKIFVTFIVAMMIGMSIQQGPSGEIGIGGSQESSGSVAGDLTGSVGNITGDFGLDGDEDLGGNRNFGFGRDF
ncbi:unnamed protein product [Spodoptera littoralis]|uniref:Uncharacterized protein n=1 Tax=Spodoptera littoralis TaxID=7109 RepID=A0A9P0I6U5_SPOLI|nr:unnamed protein product [Spodoptera littoralis]CAH1641033.1 unnamed protein product [Spodoptera littoralis]